MASPKTLPRTCGYQASGAAPFLRGHSSMLRKRWRPLSASDTRNPGTRPWQANKESQGWFDELSDEEILAAQKLLAEREGIFCEPASAASVGGALRDLASAKIPAGSLVVCTLTGHGLKDPDIAIRQSSARRVNVDATLAAVERAILDNMV